MYISIYLYMCTYIFICNLLATGQGTDPGGEALEGLVEVLCVAHVLHQLLRRPICVEQNLRQELTQKLENQN